MPDTAQDALIAVTDTAAARLLAVAAREGVDPSTTFLRVAVVPGGCSGMTYDLGWDTVRQDTDDLVESHGLQILLDARSAAYVEGTTLDFSDGLDGRGFHFANPNAVRTCACGDSFGL
ncbi:MAG: iron-sulfur cluster assembly accessory protein [Rhodothermales bacterium]|nr:iron-sulfur cluster assembly accessory protein [Rhodothermales bacterium]